MAILLEGAIVQVPLEAEASGILARVIVSRGNLIPATATVVIHPSISMGIDVDRTANYLIRLQTDRTVRTCERA